MKWLKISRPGLLVSLNQRSLFWGLAIFSFFLLPFLSLDAGISGDEYLHYNHSLKVLNYYKSGGSDKSALNTPGTHLKYYGQSFDNVTTLISGIFNVKDIYKFRHKANALAGWLTIMLSALLAVSLFGYRTGILAIVLFLISPRFIGHAFNNLKDVPFALGYIASLYGLFRLVKELPKPSLSTLLWTIAAFAFIISIRIGGALVYGYLFLFSGIYLFFNKGKAFLRDKPVLLNTVLVVLLVVLASWFLGLVFWPYGLEQPVSHPLRALRAMSQFPTSLRQIFEGEVVWSELLPWYYLPKYMIMTIPFIVLSGLCIFFVLFKKQKIREHRLFSWFLLISILFPLAFIILKNSNIYGAWRHVLFIYPPLIILASEGLNQLFSLSARKWISVSIGILFALLSLNPLLFSVRNHPYQYLYYNEIAGGIQGIYGLYETDYYFHGMREASEWVLSQEELQNSKQPDTIVIASNFPVTWWFREIPVKTVPISYYTRGNTDWDFAIIGNSYIQPLHLLNGTFPPLNTIKSVKVDGIPISAVLIRDHKEDLKAYNTYNEGLYKASIRHGLNAIAKDNQQVSVYVNLAKAYMKTEQWELAEYTLNRLLDLYPYYEVGTNLAGQLYMQTGQLKQAELYFSNTIETNYKFFPAYIQLAQLYFIQGKHEDGIHYLKKCITLNPVYAPAYKALGNYYLKAGNREVGNKYLKHANALK